MIKGSLLALAVIIATLLIFWGCQTLLIEFSGGLSLDLIKTACPSGIGQGPTGELHCGL
jgi:hypothetical protein